MSKYQQYQHCGLTVHGGETEEQRKTADVAGCGWMWLNMAECGSLADPAIEGGVWEVLTPANASPS